MKSHIDEDNESALLCRACYDHPDDPLLLQCGHIYCTECFEYSMTCQVKGCYERSQPIVDLSNQMEAIRQIFGFSGSENAPYCEPDQDDDIIYLGTRPRPLADPELIDIDSDSEDDGWDHKSQRSISYRLDDNCSFVADNASSIGGDYEVNAEVEVPEGLTIREYDDMVDLEEIGDEQEEQKMLQEELMDLN